MDLGAPVGNLGTILFDPGTLDIIGGTLGAGSLDTTVTTTAQIAFNTDGTTASDTVTNTAIEAAGSLSNVILQATTLLEVFAPVSVTNGLTMQSGGEFVDSGQRVGERAHRGCRQEPHRRQHRPAGRRHSNRQRRHGGRPDLMQQA